MVRSVETVVELLQTHLSYSVNITSAEVLRLNCKLLLLLVFHKHMMVSVSPSLYLTIVIMIVISIIDFTSS